MERSKRQAVLLFVVSGLVAVVSLFAQAATAGEDSHEEKPTACEVCNFRERFNSLIPGVTFGADLRLRGIYDEALRLDQNARGHDRFWSRYRGRVWTKIKPINDIRINLRLVTEPRLYCRPDTMEDQTIRQEALFDKMNVEWTKVLGLPLTLKAGRQDLKFGNGWLVIEGTPRDGTRTFFFDAIRATWDAKDINTTFDLLALRNHANSSWWIRPFNDRDLDLIEHDECGVILYASNKSLEKTTVDGYFIYKRDDRVLQVGNTGELYTFGVRVAGECGTHWKYRAEAAPQFGHKNGTNVCAFGADSQLAYYLHDKLNNNFRGSFEFRSGDDDPDGCFDILWGRFPHWSNIFNDYVAGLEFLASQPSNFYRLGLGWSFDPIDRLTVSADYHLLFAHQNPMAGSAGFSGDGKFRGQVLVATLEHVLNEHVSSQVKFETFFPGDYYDQSRNDVAVFARYQIMFTW